LIRNKQNMNLL